MLIDITSKEPINRVITVKINKELYEVRLFEEPFVKEFFYMKLDRNFWDSDDNSSNESEFVDDTTTLGEMVPKMILSVTQRVDMVEEAIREVENSKFENLGLLEAEVLGRA